MSLRWIVLRAHDAPLLERGWLPEERGYDRCSQQDEGENELEQGPHLNDYIR
jgi:hypothetical protein